MTNNPLTRTKGLLLDGSLLALVLILGGWVLRPGVFSVDESHYLLAASSWAEHGSFRIDNGYETVPAPQLLYFYTVVPDRVGEIGTVATVPPFQALLATGFTWLLGWQGLLWLNLLSFAWTLIVCRRIAARFRPGAAFPLAASAVVLLGSFGLEYALGIWPHSLSQTLVASAALCLLNASEGRRNLLFATFAGVLLGLATGVRLQNVVWFALLGVTGRAVLHLAVPALGVFLAAGLPALAGMALINQQRLGTLNPFTYGTSGGSYWWITLSCAGLLLLVVLGAWLRRHWRWVLPGAFAVLGLALLVSPGLRENAGRILGMIGFHLVDSSFLPSAVPAAGSSRNELGQILYGGVVKKGLLEVAPFLLLSLLTLAGRWLRRDVPGPVRFLALSAWLGALSLPFILTSGGFSFNPRYLLELTPFLALASTFWLFELAPSLSTLGLGGICGIAFALPLVANPGEVGQPASTGALLLVPMLSMVALLSVGGLVLARRDAHRLVRSLASVLAGLVLTYGTTLQLGVDLSKSLTIRHFAALICAQGEAVVPQRSLLLAWEARKDVFTPLKPGGDVWIGGLGSDDTNLPDLLGRLHAGGDRRIFLLRNGIPEERWTRWVAPYRTATTRRSDLEFVELLPGAGGP